MAAKDAALKAARALTAASQRAFPAEAALVQHESCTRMTASSSPYCGVMPWRSAAPMSEVPSTSRATPANLHGVAGAPRGLFSACAPVPKKWEQRRLVGWSPEQFYDVVSDVDHYHKFVPWCQKSNVTKRISETSLEAELEVGFQMLVERYTSKVTLEPGTRTVRSCVNDSMLFHHLDSSWVMQPGPTPASCWLTFKVDFAFNSALYSNLADLFFSEVVKQMTGAFEGRCAKIYGPSSLLRPMRAAAARPARHATTPRPHDMSGSTAGSGGSGTIV